MEARSNFKVDMPIKNGGVEQLRGPLCLCKKETSELQTDLVTFSFLAFPWIFIILLVQLFQRQTLS